MLDNLIEDAVKVFGSALDLNAANTASLQALLENQNGL
jgi:hypothetical protein